MTGDILFGYLELYVCFWELEIRERVASRDFASISAGTVSVEF